MSNERRTWVWGLVVAQADGDPVDVAHVAAAAISAAGVDGGAVTVMLSATPRETVYASDPLASELEELTLTLGEGPGIDAGTGSPALASDLSSAESVARWPAFAPAAVDAGARAVFALPLQVGGIRLGVMDLYRADAGALDDDELADALLLADTACAVLLDPVPDGHQPEHGRQPEPTGMHHPEVHQATGMVLVQLGVSAAVALIRLRAYAYSHERRLRDVAADVVARRLRFDPDTDTADGGKDHDET
jgi:GAF domain-containing protein